MKTKLADRNLYIPFALAVRALKMRKTRLRNWLIRDSVHLDADREREDGIHRRLSRLDVVRLGWVARLTALGITAFQASEAFEGMLPLRYETRSRHPGQDPDADLLEALRNSVVKISGIDTGAEILLMIDGKIGSKQRNDSLPIEDDTAVTIDIGAMMRKQDKLLEAAKRSGPQQRER